MGEHDKQSGGGGEVFNVTLQCGHMRSVVHVYTAVYYTANLAAYHCQLVRCSHKGHLSGDNRFMVARCTGRVSTQVE